MNQSSGMGGSTDRPGLVEPGRIQVQGIGARALDMRRVDVAVDLTPCTEAVQVEMVIVGPDGSELSSTVLVQNREWMLDRIIHLRQDAQPGEHILHVGVFFENQLVARAARRFGFPAAGAG